MTLIKKQLERVLLTDTKIKVIMPEKVLLQIKYLCSKIDKVEWSGILFYSFEGSMKQPESMVITLEDILPMHKGTSGYTEYTFDTRVVEYRDANQHLDDCRIAHIHSHNTMNVFFSGTDWSELEDNAPNHNVYLSLIVNNFMDFCAKVCFIAESNESLDFSFQAKDEFGKSYLYKKEPLRASTKKLICYDCDIETPENTLEISDSFKESVTHIIDKANIPIPTFGGAFNRSHTQSFQQDYEDDWHGNPSWGNPVQESLFTKEVLQTITKPSQHKYDINIINYDDDQYQLAIENFVMYLLYNGKDASLFADIEDILIFLSKNNVPGTQISNNIMKSFDTMYNTFFKGLIQIDLYKKEILLAVIDVLAEFYTGSDNGVKYKLNPLIENLSELENQLKK